MSGFLDDVDPEAAVFMLYILEGRLEELAKEPNWITRRTMMRGWGWDAQTEEEVEMIDLVLQRIVRQAKGFAALQG